MQLAERKILGVMTQERRDARSAARSSREDHQVAVAPITNLDGSLYMPQVEADALYVSGQVRARRSRGIGRALAGVVAAGALGVMAHRLLTVDDASASYAGAPTTSDGGPNPDGSSSTVVGSETTVTVEPVPTDSTTSTTLLDTTTSTTNVDTTPTTGTSVPPVLECLTRGQIYDAISSNVGTSQNHADNTYTFSLAYPTLTENCPAPEILFRADADRFTRPFGQDNHNPTGSDVVWVAKRGESADLTVGFGTDSSLGPDCQADLHGDKDGDGDAEGPRELVLGPRTDQGRIDLETCDVPEIITQGEPEPRLGIGEAEPTTTPATTTPATLPPVPVTYGKGE